MRILFGNEVPVPQKRGARRLSSSVRKKMISIRLPPHLIELIKDDERSQAEIIEQALTELFENES